MKITSEQIAKELSRPEVYLRHYGKLYLITALTTTMDEANAHMLANEGEGALSELGRVDGADGFCFVVKKSDDGLELPGPATLQAAAERFLTRANEASPKELKGCLAVLDGMVKDLGIAMHLRGIAKNLAGVLRKIK